jgi:hypothetical protein
MHERITPKDSSPRIAIKLKNIYKYFFTNQEKIVWKKQQNCKIPNPT